MSALAVVSGPTDGETDDRDLVERVRAGDDRAFEMLFRRYQPRIRSYVRRMVHDDGRAEDITQEVFIAALRRMREQTERDILFKPWIFEIAKNKCIDAFRRARGTSEVSFDAGDAIGAADHGRLAEPATTPDAAVEGKVAIDNLCGAFGGLSQVHHEILVLREFEGLSYREIGERLGMSRPAVESTLFRARKRLTEEYEELVSGERCLRVQRIVDACSAAGTTRLRDQRRMARHLAHCQPCRRYACRAGIDLGLGVRPRAAAAATARIAAFLPLPAFLRRRWGGEDAAAPLPRGGSLSHWWANVATTFDPGTASGWTKAVATAATVTVASVGAGAALTERMPAGVSGPATPAREQGATGGAGATARSLHVPRHVRAGAAKRAGERAGERAAGSSPATQAAAGTGSAPAAAAPPARAEREAARPSDSDSGSAPAAGQQDLPLRKNPIGNVLGAVGSVERDSVHTSGTQAGPSAPAGFGLDGATDPATGVVAATGAATGSVAAPDADAVPLTSAVGSVSATVSQTLTPATATLNSIAG